MIARATCQRLPLADNSIDLIFTDPPYPREYLHVYGWLAQEAARVLKPGGFVLAMCGGLWLDQIYHLFWQSELTYFYELQFKSTQNAPIVWKHYEDKNPYPIVARAKSGLLYCKGASGRPRVGGMHNLFEQGNGFSEAKIYHSWGQDVNSARYYIDYLSAPGDIVLDPFIGGGTTAVACELIGRRGIGFDVDPAALITTRDRLAGAEIPRQGMLI